MSAHLRLSGLWLSSVALASVVLIASACRSPAEIDLAAGVDLDAEILELFAEFDADAPGAAVMVIRDGEVAHASAHGLADLDSGAPLRRSTPVRLASLSKALTAMAIVLLVEQGELAYDEPAAEWIPELARFEEVTVRHLLHHTSGLPSYYTYKMDELEEIAANKPSDELFTSADAIAVYEDWGEPEFEPGSRFEYSNPGYEILGLIIARVSEQSYGEFLDQHIFEPLEMQTAIVRDRPDLVIPHRAVGYRQHKRGGWRENDDHWANWVVGSGGVYASLDDLYRWDRAVAEEALVSREGWEEIFAPAVLTDGSESPYGFGWGLEPVHDRPAVHHTGSWVGFRTAIVVFPQDALTVVVLSNATAKAAELRDAVAELALAE
ncbi:MAG: serine hydrolase domain-containing protein [Acidobacteriota bacterium]